MGQLLAGAPGHRGQPCCRTQSCCGRRRGRLLLLVAKRAESCWRCRQLGGWRSSRAWSPGCLPLCCTQQQQQQQQAGAGSLPLWRPWQLLPGRRLRCLAAPAAAEQQQQQQHTPLALLALALACSPASPAVGLPMCQLGLLLLQQLPWPRHPPTAALWRCCRPTLRCWPLAWPPLALPSLPCLPRPPPLPLLAAAAVRRSQAPLPPPRHRPTHRSSSSSLCPLCLGSPPSCPCAAAPATLAALPAAPAPWATPPCPQQQQPLPWQPAWPPPSSSPLASTPTATAPAPAPALGASLLAVASQPSPAARLWQWAAWLLPCCCPLRLCSGLPWPGLRSRSCWGASLAWPGSCRRGGVQSSCWRH